MTIKGFLDTRCFSYSHCIIYAACFTIQFDQGLTPPEDISSLRVRPGFYRGGLVPALRTPFAINNHSYRQGKAVMVSFFIRPSFMFFPYCPETTAGKEMGSPPLPA